MIDRSGTNNPDPERQNGPRTDLTPIAAIGSACRSLELVAIGLGWGLVVLGTLASLESVLALIRPGDRLVIPDWTRSTRAFVAASYLMMSYSLAGLAATVLTRLLATVISAHFERSNSTSRLSREHLERMVEAVDRLSQSLQARDEAFSPGRDVRNERESRMAEIAASIRAAEWVEAAALLDRFVLDHPDDPGVTALRNGLSTARAEFRREQQAQLQAAQDVNDPDRVLEIYHAMLPSIDTVERPALDRELASWFLTLIHRRLRTGTIQADVVNLATRFSERFATTTEGASVRAALPTLRRSAGLCPRCGQPYRGVGEACGQCNLSAHAGSVPGLLA